MPLYFVDIVVPIYPPERKMFEELTPKPMEPFTFSDSSFFVSYSLKDQKNELIMDHSDNWYFYTRFRGESLSELQTSRQSFVPSHLSERDKSFFPLINRLSSFNLKPVENNYDKAFAHVSVLAENSRTWHTQWLSRCANLDGDHDPQISTRIHYLQNIYNEQKTLFLSGWESHSFATVSDNEFYFNQIHLPNVAKLYLLYYTAFIQYEHVPAKQMMPRLLENLWRSTQANTRAWNPSLVEIDNIQK